VALHYRYCGDRWRRYSRAAKRKAVTARDDWGAGNNARIAKPIPISNVGLLRLVKRVQASQAAVLSSSLVVPVIAPVDFIMPNGDPSLVPPSAAPMANQRVSSLSQVGSFLFGRFGTPLRTTLGLNLGK
jgi:hypothetical protein